MNPLLELNGLPRFAELRPEHVAPAIDQLLAEARAALAKAADPATPAVWSAFVEPLEDANERLSRAWDQVGHLHAVLDSPALREAYNANLPRITEYYTELGHNSALFEKYCALQDGPEFASLAPARQRIVEHAVRDFRLSGAALEAKDKARFAEIQDEQAKLAARFSQNLLDATNAYTLTIDDPQRLEGIPEDVLEAAAQKDSDGKPRWTFTLRMPSYLPVMQYARDRNLRETLYRAYATRASEFTKPEWDNTPIIARMLALRHEEARLLGYRNFAEVSLVPKMAGTPDEVLGFLGDLARRARVPAERDVAELRRFARESLGIDTLQAWDLAYAAECLRSERYAFSDQEVKQYFPEDAVLGGLFGVIETLFSVKIEQAEAATWHADVRFFRITGADGGLVGEFYLDLYARESKRGGAWMDSAVTRRRKGDAIQTPVAYLVCNFSPPVGGKPALFTHDDVNTLFHEFGHGLHHLLTRVEELEVAGIHGVEWDAVELPSQFMENFCWEWDVLRTMTRHVDTGAPLPRALFDKMLAAKNFHSGLALLRQIEFSVFDMRLHAGEPEGELPDPLKLLEQVRDEVAVLRPPSYHRFPNSFGHIFGGGYAAGYYSYKWAEVLSADAYAAFEENHGEAPERGGIVDPETGARFRSEILEVGGTRPAAESFRAFRGREPKIDALLRHSGMIDA